MLVVFQNNILISYRKLIYKNLKNIIIKMNDNLLERFQEAIKAPKKLKQLKALHEQNLSIHKKRTRVLVFHKVKATNDVPTVSFPIYTSLIPIRENISPEIIMNTTESKKALQKEAFKAKYKVDYKRNVLVLGEGPTAKEYPFDILVSETSRTNKSIDKKEAVEIANVYLKLGIKPQNKKNIFVKQIREKLNLPPE
jgi:hypothetical protein